ncbi:MAG TPA: tetratricopeptide repeat protein [Vicinamibacteria bacterium]|nr:tetratricopeptide repeat protein [Vicinamibacteria bacterium]
MKRTLAAAVAVVLGLLLLPSRPARAQELITALGRVVDAQGNPVPDVQVLLDYKGHVVQKYRTKTDKKGVFTHLSVYAGPYRVTFKKEGLGEVSFDTELHAVETLQKPPDYRFVPKAAVAPPSPESGLTAAGGPAPTDLGRLTSELNAASALLRQGKADEAAAQYEAIAGWAPGIPLVQAGLASAYKAKGDPAKAETAYRKSVELDPQFVDGYVALATLLAETGKREQAVEVIEQGAAANEKSGRLQYALGVLQLGLGQPAEARAALLKAEALDPQDFEVQYQLATAAMNMNDAAEAVARYQKFVAAAPPDTPNVAVAKSLIEVLTKKMKK